MGQIVGRMEPSFVDIVPNDLEDGKLYISLKYRTVVHRCACGCGEEVNTPLHPTGWAITFDGATVDLWPSIGNWSEICQSHYWIGEGRGTLGTGVDERGGAGWAIAA